MSLITYDLMGNKRDKVQIAIDRLRAFEPEDGYYLAFSGGKDSQCIYHLAQMAGVKFDAHYRVTSVDPPELVRFIKRQYPDVSIDFPRDKDGKVITMWNLIPKKLMPPTRLVRYCCHKLKETGGNGRITVTGVRWAESRNRSDNQGMVTIVGKKKAKDQIVQQNEAKVRRTKSGGVVMNYDDAKTRRTVEQCFRTNKTLLNPIIDWKDEDVWEFLNDVVKVPHCELYDYGFKRIGCIGCPMSDNAEQELERYPKYKSHYMRAFERMLHEREKKRKPCTFRDAQHVMDWYLKKTTSDKNKLEGQIGIDELEVAGDD